ncbi:Phosphatase [Entamoeba marina]
MFGERRSKKRKGVTSPCQVRWVYYFECYIRRFFNFEAIPQHHLQIMRITTFNFEFKISGFEDARPIYYFNPLSHFNINPPLLYVQQELNQLNEKFVTYFPENIISGDVVIVFAFSSKGKIYIVGKLMFNTFFLQPNTIYRYSMTQMQDPTKGSNRNKYKLSKDCRIEMETKSVRNKEETMKLVKQIESGFEVLNTIDEIVKQRNNSNNKEATHKSIIPPNYPIPPPI